MYSVIISRCERVRNNINNCGLPHKGPLHESKLPLIFMPLHTFYFDRKTLCCCFEQKSNSVAVMGAERSMCAWRWAMTWPLPNCLCTTVYTFTLSLGIQSEERQVGLRTSSWTLDIFVISQPNWLKFGLQAHFLKMFGHAKFQLSSICSFRFLLVNFSRLF